MVQKNIEEVSKVAEEAIDHANDALTAIKLIVGQLESVRTKIERLENRIETWEK